MIEENARFVAHVKAIAPECSSSHCVVYHQGLVVTRISDSLKTVLAQVVKNVGFMKSRIPSSRCDNIGSTYSALLPHMGIQ
jgi:hypothetical protein